MYRSGMRSTGRCHSRFRRFECLEARHLLAVTTWANPFGGDYHVAANWTAGVPGQADEGKFDIGGEFPVVLNAPASPGKITVLSGVVTLDLQGNDMDVMGLGQPPQSVNVSAGDADTELRVVGGAATWTTREIVAIAHDGTGGNAHVKGLNWDAVGGISVGEGNLSKGKLVVAPGSVVRTFGSTLEIGANGALGEAVFTDSLLDTQGGELSIGYDGGDGTLRAATSYWPGDGTRKQHCCGGGGNWHA
jgi:hypothetical protein